ncbi:MAG: hypothetical protein WAQ28_15845 [Bacteroidia bacterium]|jgi:hypothetical protein
MKTTAKSLLIVSALATMTLFSCKKENNITPEAPTPSTPASLSALFSEKAAPKQTFTINAGQFQSITGAKGTKLNIQPGSFKNQSGQVVSGNVTLEMREMFSKSDMIFSGATTTSNGQLLVSGGELYIQAFQNGSPLSLTSSTTVEAQVRTNNNAGPMQEFYSNTSFETPEGLDWWLADSTNTDTIYTDYDSSDFVEYYYFYLDQMNWINCDYFWDSNGPFTDIEVNTGTQFDGTNCTVYISFDGINSVLSLGDYDLNHLFNYGYPSIPQGMNVHIIAIGTLNGQYYSAIVPATLGNNFSTNVTLTATTLAQITADVNALP